MTLLFFVNTCSIFLFISDQKLPYDHDQDKIVEVIKIRDVKKLPKPEKEKRTLEVFRALNVMGIKSSDFWAVMDEGNPEVVILMTNKWGHS